MSSKSQTYYQQPKERIFNDARSADSVIVIGMRNGQPHLWADGDRRTAQTLLSEVFPGVKLPEAALAEADQEA